VVSGGTVPAIAAKVCPRRDASGNARNSALALDELRNAAEKREVGV
jgi:hypothetical protein